METAIKERKDFPFKGFSWALNLVAFQNWWKSRSGDCIVVESYNDELLLGTHCDADDSGWTYISDIPFFC